MKTKRLSTDRMKSLFYYLYLLDDKNDSFLQKKLIVL